VLIQQTDITNEYVDEVEKALRTMFHDTKAMNKEKLRDTVIQLRNTIYSLIGHYAHGNNVEPYDKDLCYNNCDMYGVCPPKVCRYCCGKGFDDLREYSNDSIYHYEKTLVFIRGEDLVIVEGKAYIEDPTQEIDGETALAINYCPICGRRLDYRNPSAHLSGEEIAKLAEAAETRRQFQEMMSKGRVRC